MAAKKSKPQIKTIWGLASELGFDKETLYTILERETGKESMRACTGKELNKVVYVLGKLKDGYNESRNGMASKEQIWKIRKLEEALGWKDNPARLNGFIKKYYCTERIEWLKGWQAHKLIESLKKILQKQSEAM